MNAIGPAITYLRSLTFGGLCGGGIAALISHYYFPAAPINYSLLIGGIVGSSVHSTLKALIDRLLSDREIELFRKLILLIVSYRTLDKAILSIIKQILILEYVLSDKLKADTLAQQLCELLKQRDFELLLSSEHDKQERLRIELDKYKLRVAQERLEEGRKKLEEERLDLAGSSNSQATHHNGKDVESDRVDEIIEPSVGSKSQDDEPPKPRRPRSEAR